MARLCHVVLVSLALALLPENATAAGVEMGTSLASLRAGLNPVRRIVTLLQRMQQKVAEEGERAEKLFQKYQCYCKTSTGDLATSIESGDTKVPELESSIKGSVGKKTQLEEDLKSHQKDRRMANEAIAEATSIRKREKEAFDKAKAENQATYSSADKAMLAIDEGMAGSFLQSPQAQKLQAYLAGSQDVLVSDRQELLAFLSNQNQQSDEFAPSSGEISGIVKNMMDNLVKDKKDLIDTETEAVKNYGDLMAAKKKEVQALQVAIEDKMSRVADLGVQIAMMMNEKDDTAETLAEDQAFSVDLKKNCGEKAAVHEKEKAMRAVESVALADTIKVLNDDDALELFKRSLPSASSSFLQIDEEDATVRAHARSMISEAKKRLNPGERHHIDFILMALHGKKVGFDKVITLIDNLSATLKREQVADDDKKEYCAVQLDAADDTKKGLQRTISDLEAVIEDAKEGRTTLKHEIKALREGIMALDQAVKEATLQRKAERKEFQELMASDTAAKELLVYAKNRLRKFYDPRLHKAAPKRELTEMNRVAVSYGEDIAHAPGGIADTGISASVSLVQTGSMARTAATMRRDAPPMPPETAGVYSKKSEEAGGAMAMMDILITDVSKAMVEREVEEKNGQEEYEQLINDSAEKRRLDSKSLTDKEVAKADLEGTLEISTGKRRALGKELKGATSYTASLHSECDWLQQYYGVRKVARADEVDSLSKSKAVLAGADYSFLQQGSAVTRTSRSFLRHP